jgi:PAS domain S-box-containing protein
MKKNRFPINEALRLTALKELNIVDTAAEADFDDITKLASQICETPISLITLLDEHRQWFKSNQGLTIIETSRDVSFCHHAIQQPGILVVPNALEDDRFVNNPLVTGEPFIRFYAGAPIFTSEGFPLGTLCIIDRKPRILTSNQLFALRVLAKQVETLIILRSKITTLENAEEKLVAFDSQFRIALEKIGDNVWEYDFRTDRSSFSKAKNDLLGIEVNDSTDINALWWQSIYKEDLFLLEENDRKCRAGEIDAHSLEYRIVQIDGSLKWVLDRGVVIEKTAAGLPLKLIGTHTDITNIKHNKEALEESEQRWKFALEGSGDGIWDLNCKTNKVFYSIRYKEMLGYRDTEIGDNHIAWKSMVHPDDIEKVSNDLEIHFLGAMPFYRSEYRMRCKDGTYKWILDRGMITARDSNNQPLRITGTHTDISQIKYTELALEQSLKQFKGLSDNFPGVIYEYEFRKDGSSGFKYVSPTISKIFGIERMAFTNYLDYLHPDDVAIVSAKTKIARDSLEPYYCEARLIVPGRGTIWHSLTSSFSYFSEDGSKIFTGFMQDITDRKKSEDLLKIREEKYRSIIANMNLGLLEVDSEEKILFANLSFCEMGGYDFDELEGKRAQDIFISGDNTELMKNKNRARKEGVSDAYEITVKNKRGQLRWWLISGAPRYDDSGQLVGSIGIHLDITEQKKLEVELIEAREQAEESTKSKEVFLANMSHEIRTPLNAIVGMSNQLGKTNLDVTQQFYLSTINAASENLLFIINDILDISKIEAGKLQLENIGFEPREMVDRAIRVLSHKAEEKGLTLGIGSFDPAISPVLIGDPFRLNQVLLNLINNAIKFTEKGGVAISCQLVTGNHLKQTIRVSVKDSGIGMEAQFVKNLFEKFSQEDASVTRQYGGTGLGMSICRDLVELMGGEIIVDSKKGSGTAISFIIEFENGNIKNLPVKQNFAFDADMLANKKILVVDDNKMNRLVAATILKNMGAVISEAVNGQEAVDALVIEMADLVLMDIQMPVMDGVEAIGIIRKQISKSLPVIALTANAIKGDNDKYIEAGMSAYLSKPYKEKDLLNMVAFWLGKMLPVKDEVETIRPASYNHLYDLSGLRQISKNNEGFVQKMAELFVAQTPALVAEMIEKYYEGEYKAMSAIAHKIKPSIDNMGIASLKDTIMEIEKKGKFEKDDKALPGLLEFIKITLLKVVELLKNELAAKETGAFI